MKRILAVEDVVVAHYVLHDVDRSRLPQTVEALTRSLAPAGRFVAVEPVGSSHIDHALSVDQLRSFLTATRLIEVSCEEIPSLPGRAVRAIFRKPA